MHVPPTAPFLAAHIPSLLSTLPADIKRLTCDFGTRFHMQVRDFRIYSLHKSLTEWLRGQRTRQHPQRPSEEEQTQAVAAGRPAAAPAASSSAAAPPARRRHAFEVNVLQGHHHWCGYFEIVINFMSDRSADRMPADVYAMKYSVHHLTAVQDWRTLVSVRAARGSSFPVKAS